MVQEGKGRVPAGAPEEAGPRNQGPSGLDRVSQASPPSRDRGPPATPASWGRSPPTRTARPEERTARGAHPVTQPRTANVSGRGRRAGDRRVPFPEAGARKGARGPGGEGALGLAAPGGPPGVCARPARPHVRAENAPPDPVRAPSGSGQARRRAGRLTGLRRFSVTFFQSSSCSWCRKPMAGPRSGRPRAAARSSARPAGPAARRAARHRPRGAGPGASGTGSALAPPRPPRRPPLAPAPRPRRPRLKEPRAARRRPSRPEPQPPCGAGPGAPPRAPAAGLVGRPHRARPPSSRLSPRAPPRRRRALLPGASVRQAEPPLESAEAPQGGHWPQGALRGRWGRECPPPRGGAGGRNVAWTSEPGPGARVTARLEGGSRPAGGGDRSAPAGDPTCARRPVSAVQPSGGSAPAPPAAS